MQAAVQISLTPAPGGRLLPKISPGQGLPLDRLSIGREITEVAQLLPRLFNLCRHAQERAALLTLGLADPCVAKGSDILRDHLVRLAVFLPRAAQMPETAPGHLPDLPQSLSELRVWVDRSTPFAALTGWVLKNFAAGEAVTTPLPAPCGTLTGAYENSPAGRQSDHPLLIEIQRQLGRGPLWRLVGMYIDAKKTEADRLPYEVVLPDGTAIVPASRGAYALRIGHTGGRVTSIIRRTPTDHILAPGGALEQALSSLPAAKVHLAPFVLALHDPCVPISLQEPAHA